MLKIQAGSRVQLFDQQDYDLRNLDNTCTSCNCNGNDLGHGLTPEVCVRIVCAENFFVQIPTESQSIIKRIRVS